ncbi:NPCBM/NEW2 domain-containing protein [Microbacterium jejuense]|uniref:NPCBM/NEW2 domain-containing protein n=1 Tax=Microbacterium jejuense TaxID=1263637 RepID=A0ABS7HJA2_9MICO|nr:NPCBM/NEW2 domain-containing protein [Microbacterium jejuense]MBW9093019.1 NPCBM/NEW2 domain-containing protein [Microbacterium jejuense]
MPSKRTTLLVAAAVGALCLTGAPAPALAADGLAGAVHYASDLDWVSADNGWGPVERDFSNGARAVPDTTRTIQSIRGVQYPKGLGTHAPARVVYDVGQQCTQLLGYVGIDDSQAGKGRVDFVVKVDGAEQFRMARSGMDPAGRLNLDLRGASTVELIAEPGPEGNGNDHADWADLRINCTDEYLAQPLTVNPAADVDLSLLAAGSPVSVTVDGANPQTPVTVGFAGTEVIANADDNGRATASFVVPADVSAGEYTITARAESLFGAVAHGEIAAHVVAVSDTVYYVDCSATGTGDGSEAAPFTSLEQLSGVQPFQPGQSVRFRRGAECVGTFAPTGSGLATAPITVAPYGDGDAEATINGNGALAGIHLLNVSNWTIDGMHVINPGTPDQRRVGILYEINDGTKRSGVVLTRNHVEKVAGWSDKTSLGNAFSRSAGISVLGDGIGWFDGITVTDNVVNDTAAGGIKLSAPDTTRHYNEKVYVARNDIRAVGGDGIVIHNSDKPVIEYNSAIDLGHGEYPFLKGNFAGMWPYNSVDPLFQYNVVGNSVGSTYDSTAWDCDMKIKGSCTFQYNYSYGNAGGFYLDCISGCGTASTTTNAILRYNVSQDDCRLGGASGGPGLHLIYNNTFSCLNRPFEDDMTAPRQVKNNIIIATGGSLKTTNGVYANNAYFGGIQPPATETGAIVGDPQLIAAGSGRLTRALPGYELAVGSPLLGAGVPIADAGERDFFGNPIPATPNIGAYQGPGVEVAALPFDALVNQTAVASSDNPRNGAVTADYRVFSAEALADAGLAVGEKAAAFGAELDWHPTAVGTPDAIKVAGQQVSLEGEGDELIVAGFSAGAATSGTATVHYQDGTSEQVQLSLPLWSDASTDAADTVVLASAGSYLQRTKPYLGGTISTVTAPASVFAQRIPLSGKPVASVTLPEGSPVTGEGLSLFAMELAGSAVPTSVSVVTECRGPNAWVHVTVANETDAPITVAVDTVLGDDVKVALNPGKDTRSSFKIREALADGEVSVVASTTAGARTTTVVPYTGIGCR